MTEPTKLPLRDIHLPEPVSWWPPAPGWWLLAGLILLCVLAAWLWRRYRRRQRLAATTLALQELAAIEAAYRDGLEAAETVRRLSVLMRRLSISLFPRAEAAGLTGGEWLAFLDRPLERPDFSEGAGRVLNEGPYRPDVARDEVEPLLDLCREWIRAAGRRSRSRRR